MFAPKSTLWLFFVVLIASTCEPAFAIPAFARKYGLPCSACHEAWPKLNNFGQVFRDNGFQLGNERDAPIFQRPEYFPVTFRFFPQWHRESTNRFAMDAVRGDAESGLTERRFTTHGFDHSGLDLWTGGTLAPNISFLVLPAAESSGAFHFEAAWIRFDNLLKSTWLNVKLGKHELDTPVSEKRFLTLSANGGFYYLYHFLPPSSDINTFGGIGDNQVGIEVSGHSKNSYTRYSVSVLSSTDGEPGLPTNHSYDFYGHFSQAFDAPGLGMQRVGVYGYSGRSPTYYQTADGQPIPGSGGGNRPFYRAGAYGIWYAGKFDFSTVFMHGKDNVFLATGTGADQPQLLPAGARGPSWNGGFVEAHYSYSPQLILVGRYEAIRMSQQADPSFARDFGNTTAWVAGYRWYPIM